ncbi:centromere protein X [Dipodascopsis tothii]|uniref:centromere protein X n=1 Tax=Dipodascopsis tothii TaxID=44089 RepID=UPI0034CF516C
MADTDAATDKPDGSPPTFPTKTLARIFTEHFQHADTRLNAATLDASAEYLRIFTREAIWRSERARQDAAGADGARKRMLEVDDLEKIAGTLVLDF